MNEKASAFDSDVLFFSRYFGVERRELRAAFADKPEKLGALFEKSAANWHKAAGTALLGILGCAVASVATAWTLPVTIPAALYLFDRYSQPLQEVQEEIRNEVERVRAPAAKPA